MSKFLGLSLNQAQTKAAVVSAAAGIALLAVALASMKRGSAGTADAAASADALTTAFKQGYNAGATDASTTTALPGPWDALPANSPLASLAPAPSAAASSPAPAASVSYSSPVTVANAPAPRTYAATAAPSAPQLYADRYGNMVTLAQLQAQTFTKAAPTPAPSPAPAPAPSYWSGYVPAAQGTVGSSSASGGGNAGDLLAPT